MTPDKAHKDTDREIAELEKRIKAVYKDAQKDVQQKLDTFTGKFEAKDKLYRAQLEAGKITQSQYRAWQQGQVFQGKQWQAKLDSITDTLNRSNIIAQRIINSQLNGVFAHNANWQSYSLEHGAGINFGFELYDADTVARLLRDEPELLPKSRVNIPKDKKWNQKIITQQIAQGIIQGEDIRSIGKRMEAVTDRNKNLSLTRARTAMTGAENAGRVESLTRAQGMGIRVKKEWVATLDMHTRTSHRHLDGQTADVNGYFHGELGKIRFPGDPHGPAGEVYNCRCTLVGALEDYPDEYNAQRYDSIDGVKVADMSYSDWEKAKNAGQKLPERKEKPVEKPVETVEKPVETVEEPEFLGNLSSDFTPSGTLAEAQDYADRFVSSYKTKYTGNVNFKGMDVEAANTVNEVLEKVLDNYEFDRPLGNISVMNFRENKWKSAVDGGVAAAYQWGAGEGTLFINQKLIGSPKLSTAFFKKSRDLMDYVIENADVLLSNPKTGARQREYISSLKKTGRQVYAQATGNELEATIVHECGHMLDDKLFRKAFKEREFNVTKSMEKYAGNISAYSNTNNAEYIAESFTAYWYGNCKLLDPDLVKIFNGLRRKK